MVTDHKSPADRMAARAGWSLTADGIEKRPDGLDLAALLDRIEREMPDGAPETQWTMNFALAFIGIHHPGPPARARALAVGGALGVHDRSGAGRGKRGSER